MNRIFNGLFFKGNPYCIVVHWSGRPNDITRGLFAIMSGRTFLYGLLASIATTTTAAVDDDDEDDYYHLGIKRATHTE